MGSVLGGIVDLCVVDGECPFEECWCLVLCNSYGGVRMGTWDTFNLWCDAIVLDLGCACLWIKECACGIQGAQDHPFGSPEKGRIKIPSRKSCCQADLTGRRPLQSNSK